MNWLSEWRVSPSYSDPLTQHVLWAVVLARRCDAFLYQDSVLNQVPQGGPSLQAIWIAKKWTAVLSQVKHLKKHNEVQQIMKTAWKRFQKTERILLMDQERLVLKEAKTKEMLFPLSVALLIFINSAKTWKAKFLKLKKD